MTAHCLFHLRPQNRTATRKNRDISFQTEASGRKMNRLGHHRKHFHEYRTRPALPPYNRNYEAIGYPQVIHTLPHRPYRPKHHSARQKDTRFHPIRHRRSFPSPNFNKKQALQPFRQDFVPRKKDRRRYPRSFAPVYAHSYKQRYPQRYRQAYRPHIHRFLKRGLSERSLPAIAGRTYPHAMNRLSTIFPPVCARFIHTIIHGIIDKTMHDRPAARRTIKSFKKPDRHSRHVEKKRHKIVFTTVNRAKPDFPQVLRSRKIHNII